MRSLTSGYPKATCEKFFFVLINTLHTGIYNGLHCNKKTITEKGMQDLGENPKKPLPRYKIWLVGDSCQLINLGAWLYGKGNQALAGVKRPCSSGSDMICIWGFQHQRELVPFWVPGVQCGCVLTGKEDVNYIQQGREKEKYLVIYLKVVISEMPLATQFSKYLLKSDK